MDAVAEAVALGRDLGLSVERPVVLHDSNHVVVWLAPSPVVAKVGTGHHRRLADELVVGSFLARAGAPAVGPSPLIPARVFERGGITITFWEHHPQPGAVEIPGEAMADALHRLHLVLNRLPRTTQISPRSFADELRVVAGRLRDPIFAAALADEDRRLLAANLEAYVPELETVSAVRALHGSPHRFNVLLVDEEPRFIDYETVCIGPIEWDLAHLDPEAAGLYPGAFDYGLLRLARQLVSVKTAAWCWDAVDQDASMRWHAEHHLALVRSFGGR